MTVRMRTRLGQSARAQMEKEDAPFVEHEEREDRPVNTRPLVLCAWI